MIESMPSCDAPSLEWALWYLSLGLLPLPIRSAVEVDDYMARLCAEHPEWTDKQIDDARMAAEKRPCVIWRGGMWAATGVSEAQAREWFEGHPDRRIYLLTGVGSGLSVIDVDTYKGGDAGPWTSTSNTVVVTPQGGVHCWYQEREGLKTTTQKIEGVDPRGKGGGVVAPSGRSTPGRRFETFAWPLLPLPDAALQIGQRRATRDTNTSPTIEQPPSTPGGPPRLLLAQASTGFVEAVSTEAPDGRKHERCKMIVGMLCRWQPLPDDAIAAALGLLDAWLGTWAGAKIVRAGWEEALRSSTGRSEEFVVEFVSLWNAVRCRPAWPDAGPKSAREISASMWRTASAAEREAHEVAVGQRLPPAPSAPTFVLQSTQVDAEPATPGERTQLDWMRTYAYNSALDYTAEHIDARATRELISCSSLPHWLGLDGLVDESNEYGHGWGPWMDEATGGGLATGFLWVLVARRAKGGKTAFVDQHLTGLQMLGARSLLEGVGPVPLVFVVTEMPFEGLEDRNVARYVGFDQGAFRRGRRAELAPGHRDIAFRERATPAAVARRYWDRAKSKLSSRDLWAVGRRLRWTLRTQDFNAEIRSGPRLVDAVVDIVKGGRGELAAHWQIDPARIVPYVLFDPVQRHQRSSRGQEDALPGDEMIMAVRNATDAEHWITAVTSDTNQASARAGATDVAKTPDAIVAQACRGTYSVLHLADLVCALDVLPLSDAERKMQIAERRDLERRAQVWIGLSRWSEGVDHPLPFRYFPRTGRFVATDPTPPPPPAPPPRPAAPPSDPADPTAHQDLPPVVAAVAPTLTLAAPTDPNRGRRRGAKKPP